jgi:MFS family permease
MRQRVPLWLGAGFALLAFSTSFARLEQVGVTWDEVRYFESVERIQAWAGAVIRGPDRAEALSAEGVLEAWDVDRYFNPHPPVYKEAMAVTEALLGGRFGSLTGYRASSLSMFALLVGLVAGVTASLVRTTAGVGAGLALLLMPRVLGHAHIAATDMPLTLFWFVATLGLFQFVRRGSKGWLLAGAIGLGLALATKFTGWLAPVPVLAWMSFYGRSWTSAKALLLWLTFAIVVAVVVNPAAWYDPIGYHGRLFTESLSRETTVPISTFYLGQIWMFVVPWHHAVVMSLITLPVVTVALSVLSLDKVVRRGPERPLALLCIIQVGFWLTLIGLPQSPNHDGVRLWLPMFPFVAILAGIGFGRLVEAARRRAPDGYASTIAVVLLTCFLFLPAALGTVRSTPYMLSYYGELVGGAGGAADAGMEATYWFDAVTPAFLRRVEQELPYGAVVVASPNHEYYEQLQSRGWLRGDLRFTGSVPADFLLLLGRRASLTPGFSGVYDAVPPLLAVELDGVELVGLYRWSEPPVLDDEPEESQ